MQSMKKGKQNSPLGSTSNPNATMNAPPAHNSPAFPQTASAIGEANGATSAEVAFAKGLIGPLGSGYKHKGGTSGSESMTKSK